MRPEIAARFTLALLLVVSLPLLGCGPKTLVVINPQMCKSVDAQGNPKDPTTTFTTQDTEANLHFEYRDAPPNTTISCELVFTDEQGTRYTLNQDMPLTPGSHKANFKLVMSGDPPTLRPGNYEATVMLGETQLSRPRTFTVTSAGAEAAAAPAAGGGRPQLTAEERLAREAERGSGH
ncbi:MAG: hypothetical protein ACE5R4_14535 [Armatimonadota bacterium]